MYGGTKAPSLLPRYATYYIVHKESVRHIFLDGFGSHLFDLKKVVFPPIPFYVGIYALEFVKELEKFHFREKRFHRNDSQGKVATHRALLKVNFEYTNHVYKEEEVYQNICCMKALNKRIKNKTTTTGVKGSSSSLLE